MFYCSKCGSPNHKAFDCQSPNPEGTFQPPPTELEKHNASQLTVTAANAMAHSADKLDPPRWPGGPEICTKENLPAFKTKDAMGEYMDKIATSAEKKWHCDFCGCHHFKASPKVDSNGQRSGDYPTKNFRPFMRDSTRNLSHKHHEEKKTDFELPKQERPDPPPPKKTIDKPRPAAATSAKRKQNADELF